MCLTRLGPIHERVLIPGVAPRKIHERIPSLRFYTANGEFLMEVNMDTKPQTIEIPPNAAFAVQFCQIKGKRLLEFYVVISGRIPGEIHHVKTYREGDILPRWFENHMLRDCSDFLSGEPLLHWR